MPSTLAAEGAKRKRESDAPASAPRRRGAPIGRPDTSAATAAVAAAAAQGGGEPSPRPSKVARSGSGFALNSVEKVRLRAAAAGAATAAVIAVKDRQHERVACPNLPVKCPPRPPTHPLSAAGSGARSGRRARCQRAHHACAAHRGVCAAIHRAAGASRGAGRRAAQQRRAGRCRQGGRGLRKGCATTVQGTRALPALPCGVLLHPDVPRRRRLPSLPPNDSHHAAHLPLLLPQVRELLSETGEVKALWMPSIKTHAYAVLESKEQAEATRRVRTAGGGGDTQWGARGRADRRKLLCTHGTAGHACDHVTNTFPPEPSAPRLPPSRQATFQLQWPASNPKRLQPRFVSLSEAETGA